MIIIPSHISRVDTWLKDCLNSIQTKHEVMVVFQETKPPKGLKIGFDYTFHTDGRYDPGAVVWAMNNLKPDDEFMVLHDSCVIKDNLIFDVVFKGYREETVAFSNYPVLMGMFLGKYRMQIASQLELPISKTKEESVDLEESWNKKYCELEQPILLDSYLSTSTKFEQKHGRENMVLENKYLIKYKGSYNRGML